MSEPQNDTTKNIFNALTIAAGDHNEPDAVTHLKDYHPYGYFSLQVKVTGDGTAKVEYLLSNDGDTYVTPTGASDIVTAHTKTSGSSGTDMYSFKPMAARYLKFKATETGGADSIVITADLNFE